MARKFAKFSQAAALKAVGAGLAAGCIVTPSQAQASPIAPGVAVSAQAAEETARQAEAEARFIELERQSNARAGDPAFDYQLGIAAIDTGRYGEAIIALQRVLARQPGNAAARSELARAYALAGDIDTAREQFATVVDDPSLPDPVRQRFTGFVRQFDKQIAGGGSDVSGFLDVGLGYDDNINTATELNSIVIPLFSFLGAGQLGANARAQSDEFVDATAGISGVTALGRQDRLFASVLGNVRENFTNETFDQAALTGTAGYAHSFAGGDVISLSGQVQQFWLGGDGFRTSYGVIGQYTKPLSGGRALTFSGQWSRLEFDNDPLRDADRYSLGVGFVGKRFVVNLTGGKEETLQAAGDAQSFSFIGINAGSEIPVAKRLAIVAGAAFDVRRHDADDPLFLAGREDERLDLQGGLKFAVTDNLFLQPRASYTRNWSNIPLFDFERWTASIGARIEF